MYKSISNIYALDVKIYMSVAFIIFQHVTKIKIVVFLNKKKSSLALTIKESSLDVRFYMLILDIMYTWDLHVSGIHQIPAYNKSIRSYYFIFFLPYHLRLNNSLFKDAIIGKYLYSFNNGFPSNH